jgi:hypothetical protein
MEKRYVSRPPFQNITRPPPDFSKIVTPQTVGKNCSKSNKVTTSIADEDNSTCKIPDYGTISCELPCEGIDRLIKLNSNLISLPFGVKKVYLTIYVFKFKL